METPIRIPWDDWVIDLFNESFISAWVADPDYQFWQSVENLSHYKMFGRPWEHLPTKSSGLPPPLEQTMVDTSHNPGRRVFHVGFIEAVGAVMWFGERFWRVSRASKQQVLSEPWLQCAEIAPGLLRVQAAVQCFSTDQGEAGDLQRKLRALLFQAYSPRWPGSTCTSMVGADVPNPASWGAMRMTADRVFGNVHLQLGEQRARRGDYMASRPCCSCSLNGADPLR